MAPVDTLPSWDCLINDKHEKSKFVLYKITDFPESERGQWRDPVKQATRKIYWSEDTTDVVVAKVQQLFIIWNKCILF